MLSDIGTPADAVKILEGLSGADPEISHSTADAVLLAMVPKEVADAYRKVLDRCAWWASA